MSKNVNKVEKEESGGCLKYIILTIIGIVIFYSLMAVIAYWSDVTRTWNNWMDSRDNAKIESLRNDYVKACEEYKFAEAYKIVNEINTIKSWEAPEAEKYVVLHEATYILENEGVNGLTRITFIVKEHNAEWVYKDLIDIAIAMDNNELEAKLRKISGDD